MSEIYTVASLRAQLRRYIEDEIEWEELDGWLFPLTWRDEGEEEVLSLAWKVQLLLFESSGGHLTDEELRAELRPLAGMDADAPSPTPAATASG